MNQRTVHALPSLEPALAEVRERRCPYCKSERIAPGGRVLAADRMIKAEHRCEACGTLFLFVRRPLI